MASRGNNVTLNGVRVLLADDHKLVRHGIRRILSEAGCDVVGEADDGREAVRLAQELNPQVAVLDIGMPGLNGIEAAKQIGRHAPGVHVMMLSMHADDVYVVRSLQAGAKGYLLKDSADTELIGAVSSVASGRSFLSPAVTSAVLDDYVRRLAESGANNRFETLSEREREVLQLIAEGQSNKQIAQTLGVSVSTVETHRAKVMTKLNLHSTAEIVLYAVRAGLVS
jgi:two-component system response regulator NreC